MLVVLNGVVAFRCKDKIGRDQLCSLVQKLVERVLRIRCWLSEQDCPGSVFDVISTPGDSLAVRLHRKLLQVRREAVHVLVERRYQMCLGSKEIRVPDAQQTSEHGNIVFDRGLLEMVVHGVSAGKKFVEVVKADVQRYAQTDSAPDTVSTANPALEAEHVLLVNSEFGDLLLIGGQSNKVFGNVLVFLRSLEEPMLRGVRVSHRFGGGEGLGGNQEHGGFGI